MMPPRSCSGLPGYAVLLFAGVFMVLPFYFMIVTSLKPDNETISTTLRLWVDEPTLDGYRKLLDPQGVPFMRSVLNSVFIAFVTVAGNLILCPLAGYAFAKHRFPGREPIFIALLSTMMIPGTVLLVPGFLLARDFGWLNTWLPLIVPAMAGVFGVFLSRQFIRNIPDSLIEAARIDGCSEIRIFATVIMPLCKPLLATLGIFAFLGSWNSFLGPLVILRDEHLLTLPLVMALLQGRFTGNQNVQMAGAVISILPVLLIFFLFQRQIVESLANSGLKE
jgi:multiple sugar transport system permease protein